VEAEYGDNAGGWLCRPDEVQLIETSASRLCYTQSWYCIVDEVEIPRAVGLARPRAGRTRSLELSECLRHCLDEGVYEGALWGWLFSFVYDFDVFWARCGEKNAGGRKGYGKISLQYGARPHVASFTAEAGTSHDDSRYQANGQRPSQRLMLHVSPRYLEMLPFAFLLSHCAGSHLASSASPSQSAHRSGHRPAPLVACPSSLNAGTLADMPHWN
jgi:hypothetical protein